MRKILIFLFVSIGIISCSTVVDFDIPFDKPKVVTNGLFSADSLWQFQITYSKNILDIAPGSFFQPVSNATINILDKNGELIETITSSADKNFGYSYKGKTKPMAGQSYSIEVATNNQPLLRSSSKAPMPVPIISVVTDSSGVVSDGLVKMKITFKDPATEKNFYTVKIIEDAQFVLNNDTLSITQELYFDVVEQSLSVNETGLEKLINDNLFNGKEHTFDLQIYHRSYSYGTQVSEQHVRVLLLNVSEEYYKYFTTKSLQEYTNGDPFAQPVQVFTNIENGLGIFAGYSQSVVELN
jgi:uncharacterized protein YceK